MQRTIEVGKKYRHFKGKIVSVILIAKHTETMEEMVIYKHIDDDNIWARPIDMFKSLVDKKAYSSIKQKYRFELVEEND